jgi:hypothetical protein
MQTDMNNNRLDSTKNHAIRFLITGAINTVSIGLPKKYTRYKIPLCRGEGGYQEEQRQQDDNKTSPKPLWHDDPQKNKKKKKTPNFPWPIRKEELHFHPFDQKKKNPNNFFCLRFI